MVSPALEIMMGEWYWEPRLGTIARLAHHSTTVIIPVTHEKVTISCNILEETGIAKVTSGFTRDYGGFSPIWAGIVSELAEIGRRCLRARTRKESYFGMGAGS
jgi:hypothetical protein